MVFFLSLLNIYTDYFYALFIDINYYIGFQNLVKCVFSIIAVNKQKNKMVTE